LPLSRRQIITAATALSASALPGLPEAQEPGPGLPDWEAIAQQYEVTRDIINLENGNWGVMARPVLRKYLELTERVNRDNSYYSRRLFEADQARVTARVAASLGVKETEIVLTRNATEALQGLITGYGRLRSSDAVLYADLDYDSMQTAMRWLHTRRGVRVETIDIPEPASHQSVIDAYERALHPSRNIRLVLLTHLSHRTGLVLPVREIAQLARERGADVILDAAHSWGQIDLPLHELPVDFAGLNLHKWIGAPLGVGAMYIREGRIQDIEPFMGEEGSGSPIWHRVHTGTVNMAAILAVPAALDFHERIGAARKEVRLRALRDRWVEPLLGRRGIEILTPQDPRMHGGITSFRLAGRTGRADNLEISRRLAESHGIFTVARDGVARGSCIRVTPGLYTSMSDMDRLTAALAGIAA
jgi:selenocysteine lyase/cysteine desulfurase